MTFATLSTLPFGAPSLNQLFSADSLPNVGRRSSSWQVLEAFLHSQEAIAMRVMQGKSGLVMMTGIPGRPDTGAMYLYDEISRTIHSIDFAGADTFFAFQFDQIVLMYEIEKLVNMDRPKPFLVKKSEAPADNIKNVQDTPTPNPHKHNRKRNKRWKNHSRAFGRPQLVVSAPTPDVAVQEVATA